MRLMAPGHVVLALAVVVAGCGHAGKRQPTWPDAPMQLRDDSDREQAMNRLWVLPLGAERDAIRKDIADAIVVRLTDALEDDKPYAAELLLFQLASLWQLDPQGIGRGLADHVDVFRHVRAKFAKSGALEPTIAALTLLAELEPANRDEHLAELDEVLQFADDLEAAENGPEAQRARPIELLQPTVLAVPLPWLVARYVSLLTDRQKVISI